MLRNYIKFTLRNFKKRKGHTVINILGLAIALTCCLLMGLYVAHELSYDSFYKNDDRIFRVTQTEITPEKTNAYAATPFPMAPNLESEYPRLIDKTVRLYNMLEDQHTFIKKSATSSKINSYLESHFFFADSTFFEVFGNDLIRGNPKTALKKPLSLVLTPEKAHEFFGDEDPMGKTIHFQTKRMNMTVTGIIKPLPSNAHFHPDIIASFNSLDVYYKNPENLYNNWFVTNVWTYVLLHKGVQPNELSRQLPSFEKKYISNKRDKNEKLSLGLQPVKNIHLHSHLTKEIQPNGSATYVYIFITAALLLLGIACINFMNLSTARATERRREVGMRKTLGAGRFQLFLQFMSESFLLCFIAMIIAVVTVYFVLPLFNNFINESLIFNPLQNILLLLSIIGLYVVISFVAGLYPALYLSGFEPRQIVQGSSPRGFGSSTFRKGLVVVQFGISVILIVGAIVVFLQLNHMQQKNLGFDKDQIVLMPINQNLIAWEYPSFKERAEQNSAIKSVTGVSKIPGSSDEDSWKIASAGKRETQGETNFTMWTTYDFVKTYGLNLIAGRAFSRDYASGSGRSILINQKMVQKLRYDDPNDALGALFYYTNSDGEKQPMQVVGVVQDFNYASVKKQIKPLVICLSDDQATRLGAITFAAVKIAPGRTQEALAHLKKVWEDIDSIDPFNYTFQNQELNKIYASEATTDSVMTVFVALCIIVACLGLFGLASFTSLQRTKEIGIRKTLGASVGSIVMMLSGQYIKLVLIANIVVWPIIYVMASWWLQDFPYRIMLGWNVLWIFFSVGLGTIFICLLTVSYHSVKAALINPVESIRQE